MLGEKRSQSLFAPKASAEKAAATHITTGPDGRKKELPLYFGPDCPVSGNMGQNQHEAGVGEPQPADEPLRHAPADDGTGVEADPTDSVNMAEDLPRRSLNTESAGGYRAHSLFFTPENEGQDFNTVLQDVQEYISGKYSALITEGGDEDAKAQIKRYITKYVQDRRIAVKGYSGDQLVDALYTEMAEFGLLTKYIFGTGIEEINVNSWRDNPTRSDGNNLLHLINKYMDIYKADPKNLAAKAKAEKYSKILAKTLINTSGGDSAQYGQNAFFYDSAEGLLTAMFLLVAEYLPTEDADGNPIEKRHIVSVFKLVQELLAPSRVKGKNQFQLLLEKLPPNHKARWFAGSALNTAEQAMASVISTVLSRLNAFLDSEMEQILCFDTAIDAEKFCNEKSAIFIVLPEEDQTKYFMVSLILQNLYREILTVADENGGRLKNRVVFFADELGTCPPIQSLELMFSASRSRGLMLVPIVQSITGQLQKNYGKEGSEIIVDNCQVNLYGGFAPASQTAVELSKSLGSRTVMSGSISRGKNDPSQSLQMMERPLMTPDELKSMPKGSFIVAKTGVHPMKVKLRLFLDWGIRFGMPYEVPEKAQRFVAYADKQELEESIIRRHYGTIVMDSEQPQGGGTSAGGMAQGIQAAPDSRKTVFRP